MLGRTARPTPGVAVAPRMAAREARGDYVEVAEALARTARLRAGGTLGVS